MGKTQHQKDLLAAYKERTVVGGVCALRSAVTGRVFLISAPDPKGQRNRFQFSVSADACMFAALLPDWRAHGGASFTFDVLEELEKKPDQTDRQFRDDLDALTALWRERLAAEGAEFY